MVPIIDVQVVLDINKTTVDTAYITGAYTVIFTLLNEGPSAAEIYDKNNNLIATINNQGDTFNPAAVITLPEMPFYTTNFAGYTESTTISVSVDAFATVIKKLLLENSIVNYNKPDIVPTLFGYPAFNINYAGESLADYLDSFYQEHANDLVPFSVPGIYDPATYVALNLYKNRINIPLLLQPSINQNMTYNGSDYSLQEGQMLLLKNVGDIESYITAVHLYMKADDKLSSGIGVKIYSDVSNNPGVLLASGAIAKVDISQSLKLTEIPLDVEIYTKDFWIQIVPLNSYSTHTLGLSDQSNITETRFSRYTNGEPTGADEGKTYGEVAEDALDVHYVSSSNYPIFVTDITVLVTLNKVYKEVLKLDGFDGPCFVVFDEYIQLGKNSIPYGATKNRAISDIVAAINVIPNYEAKLVANTAVATGNLYSMYRVPELVPPSPVGDIELAYSNFVAPDDTNRNLTVRMKAISVRYDNKHTIQLLPPFASDTGEWNPRVSPGFIDYINIEVGDEIYDVDDDAIKTVTDVTSINVELDGLSNHVYSDIFEVVEPTAFPVVKHSQVPVQLSAKAFKVDRIPLYLEGGLPLFAFNTGEDLETPLVNKLEDFDDENGILVFPTPLRYDINKFVSYYYIEKNYIESTIDVKVAPSYSVNIYLSANPATPLLALNTEYPIVSYNGEICILIGSYRITGDTSPADVAIVDARVKGGGVSNELSYDRAFELNPAVTGFYDIGYNTGKRIPQAVLTLALPETIKAIFTEAEINDIAYKHVTAGTKVYIEYKPVFQEDPSLDPSSSSGSSSSS